MYKRDGRQLKRILFCLSLLKELLSHMLFHHSHQDLQPHLKFGHLSFQNQHVLYKRIFQIAYQLQHQAVNTLLLCMYRNTKQLYYFVSILFLLFLLRATRRVK